MERLRTPEQCANPRAIKDFLRQSRRISDDNVQNLLGHNSCDMVIAGTFREWRRRDAILDFCSALIGSPPSEDTKNVPKSSISQLVKHARDHVEFQQARHDPRIDTYAARDDVRPELASDDDIKLQVESWLTTERMAEDITRDTTKAVLASRCSGLGSAAEEYTDAYAMFLDMARK